MHVILTIGVIAVLLGFAFGEVFARAFVGTILGLVALGALLLVSSVLWDLNEINKAESRVSVVSCDIRASDCGYAPTTRRWKLEQLEKEERTQAAARCAYQCEPWQTERTRK
jgi:hypothetical protein